MSATSTVGTQSALNGPRLTSDPLSRPGAHSLPRWLVVACVAMALAGCNLPEQQSAEQDATDTQAQAMSVCGNGIVESGERCDDGNVTGGDGCSAWCSPDFLRISAMGDHTVLLRADQVVMAWGYNGYGQLGDDTTASRAAAERVPALDGSTFKEVAGGGNHTLALRTDGTAWAWGHNASGQLGDATTAQRNKPVQVPGLTGVAAIAAGGNHSLAVRASDGAVWAWGYNASGQLGDNTLTQRPSPVLVPGLTSVVAVAAGSDHSLALRADGTVWAWGYNAYGQLGNNTSTSRGTPVQVAGLTSVVAIAANGHHSLALRADGTVRAWGYNASGQLGNGTTTSQLVPVQVTGLTGVSAIAAGGNHSLAALSDGTVRAWGHNASGQLGDNTTLQRNAPVVVVGVTAVRLAAGTNHSVALRSDGSAWSSGSPGSGQLGNGLFAGNVLVASLVKMSLSCGNRYLEYDETCDDGNLTNGDKCSALCATEAGPAYCGNALVESGEQCDDGNLISSDSCSPTCARLTAGRVSALTDHTSLLRVDGMVMAWGYNGYGQLGDDTTASRAAPSRLPALDGSTFKEQSAGGNHTLALRADGTAWAWGHNASGQLGDATLLQRNKPVQVSTLTGLTGVAAIAAGGNHSLAVRASDGTVWAWGYNASGQLSDGSTTQRPSPVLVPGLKNMVAVAAGSDHSLALRKDGTVWSWGYNAYGQLGDGSTVNRLVPMQVAGLTAVVAIAANGHHSLALRADGTVWAWGYNASGQLGNGTTTSRTTPVQVSGLTGVVAIAAGGNHSLAALLDGTVRAWGHNASGQLGDNTTLQRNAPVVAVGVTAVRLAAGTNHSVALRSDGSASAFGHPGSGQLGNGLFAGNVLVAAPVRMSLACGNGQLESGEQCDDGNLTNGDKCSAFCATEAGPAYCGNALVESGEQCDDGNLISSDSCSSTCTRLTAGRVSALADHTSLLRVDGRVMVWGYNGYGQLGDDTTASRAAPSRLPALDGSTFKEQSAGGNHTLALRMDGTAWAWGHNASGQLGDATTTQRNKPVQVPGLTGVAAIAAGGNHSLAVRASDGAVWAWGYNASGQLGDNTLLQRLSPVLVPGLTSVVAVAAGSDHSLALRKDGTVWAWGYNAHGQLGNGSTANRLVLMQVAGLTSVVAIAANGHHSLALRADGTVWAWGYNASGQLGNGTTTSQLVPVQVSGLTGVVAIAAGGNHSLAALSDGTVRAWGHNASGQLGDNTTLQRNAPVVAVGVTAVRLAAGTNHSVALRSDGSASAFGSPGSGQLGNGLFAGNVLAATPVRMSLSCGNGQLEYGEQCDDGNLNTGDGCSALCHTEAGPAYCGNALVESGEQCDDGNLISSDSCSTFCAKSTTGRVSALADHTSLLRVEGTVLTWGYNGYGQLGDDTTASRAAPSRVPALDGSTFKEQSAGGNHTLALRADGTAWAWGHNASGQLGDATLLQRNKPVQVSTLTGLTGVAAIAAGGNHSLAVRASDGTVWAWGYNASGQLGDNTLTQRPSPVLVPGLTSVVAVAAGNDHSLALRKDGTVWSWGYNAYGQLGEGSTVNRLVPMQVAGLTAVVAIAANGHHSLAMRRDGTMLAWGYNASGQLGNGTTTSQLVPTWVSTVVGVRAIAAGGNHSLATLADGSVWAWGHNASGQLGDGTLLQRTTPVELLGVTAVKLAAGTNHSVALRADGSASAWGLNSSGQLGTGAFVGAQQPASVGIPVVCGNGQRESGETCDDGNLNNGDGCSAFCSTEPGPTYCGNALLESSEQCDDGNLLNADGCSTACQKEGMLLAAGGNHTLQWRTDGTLWAWGHNGSGQLGDGTTTDRASPVRVASVGNLKRISAGVHHSVALRTDGALLAWGYNAHGQLGDNTTTNRTTAIFTQNMGNVLEVAAGGNHTVVARADGTAWAWGYNASGQLGDGTLVSKLVPVQVPGLTGVRTVAAGTNHSLAVRASDGAVWAWGYSGSGQLGDGTTTQRLSPVLVSALRNVLAVAGGGDHSLALRKDGTVWSWGYNGYGQLGDGSTANRLVPVQVVGLTRVVAIAANGHHSLALRKDGTVWAWGYNASGQLGNGSTTSQLVPVQVPGLTGTQAIAAGGSHSAALPASGIVQGWGNNASGQLGTGSTTASTQPKPAQLYGVCGNGAVEPGEQCDDGNTDNTDGCVSGCLVARCGDTFVRTGVESCDDGNTADGDSCSAYCKPAPTYATNDALAKDLCTALMRGRINDERRPRMQMQERFTPEDTFPSIATSAELNEIRTGCAAGTPLFDALLASLNSGSLTASGTALHNCLGKAERARSTTTVGAYNGGTGELTTLEGDADCKAILTGPRTQGQACTQHWECAQGLLCQAEATQQQTRVCEPPVGAGGTCGPSRQCASTLECVENTCRSLGGLGATCGTGQPSCATSYRCDSSTLKCVATKGVGAACQISPECGANLFCASSGLCATLPAAIADGQACAPATDRCATRHFVCRPETPGGTTHKCLARGAATQACTVAVDCASGMDCDAGRCVALPGLGQACTNSCRDDLYCGNAGVCIRVPDLGQSCLPDAVCRRGYCGADGLCREFSDVGQSCGVNGIPNRCKRGACSGGVCVGGSVGDSCLADSSACVAELGLVCNANFTCVTAPGAGSPSNDGQCTPGTSPNASDICEAPLPVGAACTSPADCASSVCTPSGKCGVAVLDISTQPDTLKRTFTLGFTP